ncbi:MAG: hypothetical protein ING69_10820 [Rhodocyclaceae bacterium]|nr:hypothetical protein [Rhodocyclaceae bacterium]
MAFLFADTNSIASEDLLSFCETQIRAGGWRLLDELNLIEWRSAKNTDARRVGEALAELFARAKSLPPPLRKRLIELIDGKEAKSQIPGFFSRFSEPIRRLRRLEVAYSNTMRTAAAATELGAVRVTVYVPEVDVDELKSFAAQLMQKRGIALPVLPRGRPKKA